MRNAVRGNFPHVAALDTRWMDNDAYGHVNNVIYYSYFDTAVNRLLIEGGVLDVLGSETIGLVVDTGCSYFRSIAFPDKLDVGLRVARIGNTSVRYELAIFRACDEPACAAGHFIHVYVNRRTGRPVSVPDNVRALLEPYCSAQAMPA